MMRQQLQSTLRPLDLPGLQSPAAAEFIYGTPSVVGWGSVTGAAILALKCAETSGPVNPLAFSSLN